MKYVGLRADKGGTILIENIVDSINSNINLILEKIYN